MLRLIKRKTWEQNSLKLFDKSSMPGETVRLRNATWRVLNGLHNEIDEKYIAGKYVPVIYIKILNNISNLKIINIYQGNLILRMTKRC